MSASESSRALSLSSNALTVLEKRYLVKNDKGKPAEQPEDLFWRVARTIAAARPDVRGVGRGGGGAGRGVLRLMAERLFMPNSARR